MNDWYEIKDNLVIYKIEDFARKLEKLNRYYSIEAINQYHGELKESLNNFDIEKIEEKIGEFPKLVENIKAI
jgi:hypothetical protein